MTKHQRKPAKAQPITANPLFPAVVALWFGAAFGLGSLAVRPSLLEDLVLKSHIDLVLPAAAPPLGITARILLALVLAALGAVLGIILARRLTRTKPEAHERKRGARDLSAASPRVRNRDAHPDAPARRPISAHEELGDEEPFEAARPAAGLLANRRRSLAISEDEPDFVPHDAAPLPGLDPVQPLDLALLALPVDLPLAPQATYEAAPASPAHSLDWTRPAPVPAAIEPAPISAEAAHRDGRQVFGMTPLPAPDTAPRQIFGVQAEADHVPQDFVKAAGFQTSVFDTAEPSPLFERAEEIVSAPAAAVEPEAPAATPAAQTVQPQIASPVAAEAAPVPAEPLPSPSSLGMTDLAARLADSMRRRRERAQGAAVPAASSAAPEAVAAAPVPTEFQTAAAVLPKLPALPAAFTAPVGPQDAAEPVAVTFEPEPVAADAIQPQAPGADAQPRFVPPVAEPKFAPAAPMAMPAAMRPLALDAFLEDGTGFEDTSLLPPRHFAMPLAAQTPPLTAAPFAAPIAADVPGEPEPAVPADEMEPAGEASLADVADDNPYASLLGVTPARQAHVRIDEPEPAADAEIEPVVIFPGQTGLVVPLTASATAVDADDEVGFRRFDAPGSAGQGQPVAGGTSASLIPPDEAAQALRAALSNLQRMSGAA